MLNCSSLVVPLSDGFEAPRGDDYRELDFVVVHRGIDLESGHYVVYVKLIDGSWISLDDGKALDHGQDALDAVLDWELATHAGVPVMLGYHYIGPQSRKHPPAAPTSRSSDTRGGNRRTGSRKSSKRRVRERPIVPRPLVIHPGSDGVPDARPRRCLERAVSAPVSARRRHARVVAADAEGRAQRRRLGHVATAFPMAVSRGCV